MKLNDPPAFPVDPLLWISNMPVSADKRHRQAAFQPKHCLSLLNIMHLAPKTAPSGRLLNKTAPVGPATDFTNRLFPLIPKTERQRRDSAWAFAAPNAMPWRTSGKGIAQRWLILSESLQTAFQISGMRFCFHRVPLDCVWDKFSNFASIISHKRF